MSEIKQAVKTAQNTTIREETPITLGRGSDGKLVQYTLGEMKSTLIAGLSGSGKSSLLQHIADQACGQAQVLIIDLKRISFLAFKGRENCSVITDINKCPQLFQKLTQALEQRFQYMEQRNTDKCPFGRIVVIADEIGELFPFIDKNTYDQIRRILSLGRACNITLIMATQSPSRRLLTGAITDLFPSKIGLRCNSVYASKIAIDQPGCEKLPNYSALYLNPQGFLTQFQLLPPMGDNTQNDEPTDTIEWDDEE